MKRKIDSNVTTGHPNVKWLRRTCYIAQLPDHIASSREEIEREINNSLKEIEESNEILRGIKFLSRRVKLSRRVSKKRRLRLDKLGQVVKQCEELQEEYETKYDNLESSTVDNVDELESCTVDATDGVNADTLDDPNNLDSSDELGEDSNEFKSITVDDNDELESCTVDDGDEFESSTVDDSDEEKWLSELYQEYTNKICDYLQEQLFVTFNMRDEDVRYKELGDVLFYYLMKGEEPNKHVQKIIHRLYYPLYDHTNSDYNFSCYEWYEFCCKVLNYKEAFTQFYKRLDNNKTALEYLLYKRPQLLLNKESDLLIYGLIEHLPYDNLHQIITNIRDKNGQTCMFYIYWCHSYVKLYINHIDDLYELLSIRNTTGQTALHVNTRLITDLLADTYTPKQRDAFIKLTSITDNNNQTALQVSNDYYLRLLIRGVENNKYIMWSTSNTNILIIYNTNNRKGAEEEAQIIYNACKSEYDNVTLEKNKSEDEIIDCITRSANKENQHNYLPSSLIVILMSHGSVGTIDDYHGNLIKLSDIEAAMCCNHLDGRPKMLITQCCQIGEESVKTPAYTPTHKDFCAVMSCVAGQPSERGVFIEKLAEQIENSRWETNMFKLVNSVSKEMEREEHKQTPIIMSTLTAHFNPTDVRWFDESYFQSNSEKVPLVERNKLQAQVTRSNQGSRIGSKAPSITNGSFVSIPQEDEDSKLSLKAAITTAKSIPPELTPKKCIKPDEILFYLIDKKIDVEMVRFGEKPESYEIFMNRAQWAGIEQEFRQHFKRDPPLDIVLQPSDDCGVVTELSGYTDSDVSVSIGEEHSNGKVSLILLKSKHTPFMLMMAHVLRDLKGLKRHLVQQRHLGEAAWKKMWGLKSISFDKDHYIAVIDALNMLLDEQELKIELNYPEQPNGQDRVTFSGTKIVGIAYDVAADQTAEDWNKRRNRLPPDNLPIAFLACDAVLIQLDINSSTIPAMHFQDFDRIRIVNNEHPALISNIFEVLDLTDATWKRIALKPLFCADLRLDVQMPPRSEARRAREFGPRSMWKPRLITELDDDNSRLFDDGNSGMISVRENDDENGSISAVGAIHSAVRRMRHLNFIPIWHQLRAIKYLPGYDPLVPEHKYFLINQDRPIDFSPHITRAQTRKESSKPPNDCCPPADESDSDP